jgi:hypothetical protein
MKKHPLLCRLSRGLPVINWAPFCLSLKVLEELNDPNGIRPWVYKVNKVKQFLQFLRKVQSLQ